MEAYLVSIAIVVFVYALLAIGLNLQFGETGLINFGHVAFFALGAYTSALLAVRGWPVAITVPAAAAVAAVAAIPLGYAAVRLRDDYLAIVTLGFAESVRILLQQEDWLTGGVQGLAAIPPLFAGLGTDARNDATLAAICAATVVSIAAVSLLQRSPFGRVLRAIRDNEEAVAALGKNVAGYKVRVFMIGAAVAGIAGAFYAHFITFISPEQFAPLVTFHVWMCVILGGAGTHRGALAGAFVLVLFLEGTRFLRDLVPQVPQVQLAYARLGVIGLALVLLVLYRPHGLFGRGGR